MYLIYGKVVKPYRSITGVYHEPQSMFRALNKYGVRVTSLNKAYQYTSKEEAQEIIDKAKNNLKKSGHDNCVEFEIRKSK